MYNRIFHSIMLLFLAYLLIGQSNLPPLLITQTGERVVTVKQWEEMRKPEVQSMFEELEYGRWPDADYYMVNRVLEEDSLALGGIAHRKQVEIKLFNESKSDSLTAILLIYLPANSKNSPVFLGLNFRGNQAITNDKAVFINPGWIPSKYEGVVNNRATEGSRGTIVSRWPVEFLVRSGYGVATVYNGDFDPDYDDGFKNGLHGLLGAGAVEDRKGDDWGTISAWAFGLSRAMDYLVTDPDIDPEKVLVIGHSRLGKTALWAGALDERFAITISNNSGCGGAALSKRKMGETVKMINTNFPHWFCNNFKTYNDREEMLPFDQHMLIALMAPRPVYIASAEEDLHADPEGEFLSAYAAFEVYRLYGLPCDLPDQMPAVNKPIHKGLIGYHVRSGKHDITLYDWQQYVKFADKYMR